MDLIPKSPPLPLHTVLKCKILYMCYTLQSRLGFLPHLEDFNAEEVAELFRISSNKLRMYGTHDEFMENVEIFRNFEKNHFIWGDEHDFFSTTPFIYQSMKDQRYITKMDACIILQNYMKPFCDKTPETARELQTMIHDLSRRVGEKLEFVKINRKIINDLKEDIRGDFWNGFYTEASINTLEDHINRDDFTSIIRQFQRDSPAWNKPTPYNNPTYLESLHPELPTEDRAKIFVALYKSIVAKYCFNRVVSNYPEMFQQNSDPITVRLFEDGYQKFVMVGELVDALNRNSVQKLEYEDEEFTLRTLSWEAVNKRFKEQIVHIEFIRTPILRAKHRAVPIRSHKNDTTYVLAVDVLLEFFRNMIFGQRYFQMPEDVRNSKRLDKIFKEVDEYLNVDYNSIYFLKSDCNKTIQSEFNKLFEFENLPELEVRDVGNFGFKLFDLKNELHHLNIGENFTNILDYADVVFNHVNRVKKADRLRTCDMFDAVKMCQLICIFKRWPKFQQLIHNQKACQRIVGLSCEWCENDDEETEDMEIPGLRLQETIEINRPRDNFRMMLLLCISILVACIAYLMYINFPR